MFKRPGPKVKPASNTRVASHTQSGLQSEGRHVTILVERIQEPLPAGPADRLRFSRTRPLRKDGGRREGELGPGTASGSTSYRHHFKLIMASGSAVEMAQRYEGARGEVGRAPNSAVLWGQPHVLAEQASAYSRCDVWDFRIRPKCQGGGSPPSG